MKITYDLESVPEHRTRNSEELSALKIFLASQHKNMCFEYDTAKEAVNRYKSMKDYRRRHQLQEVFEVRLCGKCFYVVRLKKNGTSPRGKQ